MNYKSEPLLHFIKVWDTYIYTHTRAKVFELTCLYSMDVETRVLVDNDIELYESFENFDKSYETNELMVF